MTGTGSPAVNISREIDEGALTRFQVRAIALCSLVAFLDGLDSQSIAVAAPIIVETIGATRAALGPIFSAGLLGAMLGALTFGPLGDRFGRKRMLIGCAALFGIFTILTAFCSSYPSLLAVRLFAGLGLGGATPLFIALASEYAPQRRRAVVASLIWAAFPLGGLVGSFLNAALLASFGWRSLFLIGGALPLLVALALLAWLPESIRYMIATGADPVRIRSVVARVRPGIPAGVRFVADEGQAAGVPVTQLFAGGVAARTLLLWVPFFAGFGILAIVVVWTPVLLRDHGISLSAASFALGVHGIGALIGMSCAGRLLERFGALAVLVPSFLLGAASTAALGYAAVSAPAMETVLFLVGISVGTGASGSIALAALIYPTAMRSSGIGCAMGVGRFGQVLAPLAAAAAVAAGWTGERLFLLFAVVPALGALAIVALHRRTPVPAPRPAL